MLACPPTDVHYNPRLETILAAYLQAEESGQSPDRQSWLARYPDLADELQAFFDSRDEVPRLWPARNQLQTPCRFGDYELLEEIAHGGMGIVYKARQLRPNRIVALKLILAGQVARRADVERFHAEAEAAASLDHPHIVPIYEVGEHAGQHYFTMKLIDGGSLAEARGQGTGDREQGNSKFRFQISEFAASARLLATVARAVHFAHQRGILHRDLKPSNILLQKSEVGSQKSDSTISDLRPLTSDFVPYVTDFGLAKRVEGDDSLSVTGAIVGTPLYMAPEQAAGHTRLTTAADIYSLGAILYWLVTGQPAIQAASTLELLKQLQVQDPVPPRTINPKLDRDLETICLKCLEKDPLRRYGSAEQLADELDRWLAGEPILARPVSTIERTIRRCRKNPLVSSLIAAVVLVALTGLAGVLTQWQVALANEQKANENAAVAQQNEQEAVKQRDEVKALNEKLAAKEQQLQRTLYAANMNLARHAWEEGGIERVAELLAQHRPKPGENDLRGFEWHYLNRLCHSELLTIKGHTGLVFGMAYSPDGKRLASASRDHTAKVWDAGTGQELLTLKGHADDVFSVSFSPDGKRLASVGGVERTVKVWDAQTGQEVLSLAAHVYGGNSVAFSPDGNRLASGGYEEKGDKSEYSVKVWDAQTGQELLSIKGHAYDVTSVSFSPDGKRLASASLDNTVKLWDAQTGQELLSLKGHTGAVSSVTFSPNGKLLAGVSDETAKVWDAKTGQELHTLKHSGATSVAFSPDGQRLVADSGGGTLRIWDLTTGKELRTVKGGGGGGFHWQVAFSPDGRRVASAASGNTVKVWDAQKDQENFALQGAGGQSVAFSPDFRRLASASRDTVNVWDAQSGQQTLTLKGHTVSIQSVAFSPDGKRLASGGGGQNLPDGSLWSGAGDRGEVKVWDAQTAQELLSINLSKDTLGPAYCVAFSPDGRRLATTHVQGTVKFWDAQSGQELITIKGRGGPVRSVAFSPDGKCLTSSSGGGETVKVWDSQTGQEILSLKDRGQNVAYSPDGKRLASGSKVWDAQTGQELLTLQGGGGKFEFSPDGKRLVSGSTLWDAETGQELLSLKGAGHAVAFSPDGHRLATNAPDGTVKIYDATPLPEKP